MGRSIAVRLLELPARFWRHMQYNTDQMGFFPSLRLGLAVTWGEVREYVLPNRREQRIDRDEFDKTFNVETSERWFLGDMVGADNEAKGSAIRYEPITPVNVTTSVEWIEEDLANFSFIDIGAGKGKVLFVAAQYPFKQIIGVEYDPTLAQIARKNAAQATVPNRRCGDLTIKHMDARKFSLPEGKSVLFFFFPFKAPLLTEVLDSFGERLADCYLIWVTLEEEEAAVLDANPYLERYKNSGELFLYRGQNLSG